jgi:hypothetical protein
VEASVVILILMLLAVGKYWKKIFFFFVNLLSKKIPHIIFQRKFKHWWSTIPPISTIWTITSHIQVHKNIDIKFSVHCTFLESP